MGVYSSAVMLFGIDDCVDFLEFPAYIRAQLDNYNQITREDIEEDERYKDYEGMEVYYTVGGEFIAAGVPIKVVPLSGTTRELYDARVIDGKAIQFYEGEEILNNFIKFEETCTKIGVVPRLLLFCWQH